MRILRLDLRAFGPFSDVCLDLSAGNQGFHLIYGPNEAGKTSALRALRNLLYGIPARTPDDFIHDYGKLRIGATLARRDGRTLEIVRRKASKGTLLSADEKETLDESVLSGFLGNCDQAQFNTMFGIDHAGLIAGGQDIIRGQGEIGHVLFAAGAGISDLRTIRNNLELQAEQLFKPLGSKPAVNQALTELNKVRKIVRETSMPSSDWQKHKTALEEATSKLTTIEEELAKQSQEKSRLQRIAGALPGIGRLKQSSEQLAAMGNVPGLPADFSKNRLETASRLETARRAEQEAQAEIARLDAQIAGLAVPEGLVSRAADIESLYKELSVQRKAQSDLPGLIIQRDHFEKEAAALLAELRPDLALADADQLRLSRRQQVEIQSIGNQQGALEKQLSQARAVIADAQERLGEITEQLANRPPPCDTSALADAVRDARGRGNLSQQADGLRSEISSATTQANIDLDRLGLWSGPLSALEALSLPAAETISRFDRAISEAQSALARWQGQLEKARAEAADIERQLEQLRLEGEVPSEAQLAGARESRDALWRIVLKDWRNEPKDEDIAEQSGDLATTYEKAVRESDELSDRLRREAARVANRATLMAYQVSLQQQIAEQARQHDAAASKLHELDTSWQELWQPVRITPLPPREMQVWMQRQQALVQQVQSTRQRTTALAALDEQINSHRRAVLASLPDLDEKTSLDTLLARANDILDAAKAAVDERSQLEREKTRLDKSLSKAEGMAQQAESDLGDWRARWATAIAPLGLAANASTLVVNTVVSQSVELFSRLNDAAGYRERVQTIDRDYRCFLQNAGRLLAAIDPDSPPPGDRLEAAIESVSARLRKAIADKKNLDLLQTQRTKLREKHEQAHEQAAAMTARLAVLCKEAGCDSAEDLPAIETAAAEAQRLRQQCDTCREQLLELSAGATLDELIDQAAAIVPDALPGELRRIGETISDLERTRGELIETKGGEKAVLAGMDTSAAAAEAAEDAQDILARLESDSQSYLRLRLASAVLREGIERYRKKNEGAVLSRASELFRRLTLGSFEALQIDFDDQGEQHLAGKRPDGRPLLTSAMSEGTCDQLYLALRLASLETWMERNEPLPLIVDDILVSFDNARAVATLEVLAELSARTQVIFFAHHEHLVELAKQCMPAGVLFEHQLRPAIAQR